MFMVTHGVLTLRPSLHASRASELSGKVAALLAKRSLLEICCKVCWCDSGCSLALGAAPTIKHLLKLRAIQRGAHHVTAENRICIVVHTNAASHALRPRAVFGHIDVLCPAQWAARARVRWGNILEGRLAVHCCTRDARASICDVVAGRVHRILQASCQSNTLEKDSASDALHCYK